jgi:acetylornithine deacetylase/succinyl-diaminopimelate desuccinylase-like protein
VRLEEDAVGYLRALIRFDTSNPPGGEGPAAAYVAGVGRAEGLEAHLFEAAPGRGSAVLRLAADGSIERPILLLSHLDTVPAEAAKWRHGPWSAEVADGCVWGRGAIDSKLTTAVQLAALLDLARSGARLRRDVVLAATAGEEGGGPANGAAWLAGNRPDLVGAEHTLNEHGGFCLEIGRRRYYTLAVAEKGGCAVRLVARGAPGHASVPHADNALYRLGRALARLGERKMPPRVTPTARAFVEAVAADHEAHGSAEVAAVARALLDPARHDEALAALPTAPATRDLIGAALRNTAAPTVVEGGVKANVIPSEAVAVLSGRPLPGVTREQFLADLRGCVGDEVEVVAPADGFAPGLEHRRDRAFEVAALRALRRHDPGAVLVPFLVPLGTDAKRMTRLGQPIYGFVPMLHEPGLDYMSLCHGHDERVSLASVGFGARVLRDLLGELAGAEGRG